MTDIRLLIKPWQTSEIRTLGKVLFVLGVGGLSFSGTCLLVFKDFCSEHPYLVFFVLISSFGLILAGETILACAPQSPAADRRPFLRWLAEPVTKLKDRQERRCSFCGTNFVLPTVPRRRTDTEEREFDRLLFGVCLGCGKTVCPRCAYMKGFDMHRKSLHCPGCASLVL